MTNYKMALVLSLFATVGLLCSLGMLLGADVLIVGLIGVLTLSSLLVSIMTDDLGPPPVL